MNNKVIIVAGAAMGLVLLIASLNTYKRTYKPRVTLV